MSRERRTFGFATLIRPSVLCDIQVRGETYQALASVIPPVDNDTAVFSLEDTPTSTTVDGSRQFPPPDCTLIGVIRQTDEMHAEFFQYAGRCIVLRQRVRTYEAHAHVTKRATGQLPGSLCR